MAMDGMTRRTSTRQSPQEADPSSARRRGRSKHPVWEHFEELSSRTASKHPTAKCNSCGRVFKNAVPKTALIPHLDVCPGPSSALKDEDPPVSLNDEAPPSATSAPPAMSPSTVVSDPPRRGRQWHPVWEHYEVLTERTAKKPHPSAKCKSCGKVFNNAVPKNTLVPHLENCPGGTALLKKEQAAFEQALRKVFVECKLPAELVEVPCFQELFELVAPQLLLPTPRQIAGPVFTSDQFVDEEVV